MRNPSQSKTFQYDKFDLGEWLGTVKSLMIDGSKTVLETRMVDMNTAATPVTPHEICQLPGAERLELIDGELVESPVRGGKTVWTAGKIFAAVRAYAKSDGGWAFFDSVGYQCHAEAPNRTRRSVVSDIAAGLLVWVFGSAMRRVWIEPRSDQRNFLLAT